MIEKMRGVEIKVFVVANGYSLSGDRGKISLRWSSNGNLSRTDKSALVRRIEALVANEIENDYITHPEQPPVK